MAVRDQAFLPAGGEVTIDPLENDSDPAGKVLVLQSVEVPDGSGLSVAVLEHHLVQIRSDRTLDGPVALRYAVSNGQDTATGEIVVHPIPPSTVSQPPVVPNVEVSVRTGGVVTIPVLEKAYDPDGDRLTLLDGAGGAARRGRGPAVRLGRRPALPGAGRRRSPRTRRSPCRTRRATSRRRP